MKKDGKNKEKKAKMLKNKGIISRICGVFCVFCMVLKEERGFGRMEQREGVCEIKDC